MARRIVKRRCWHRWDALPGEAAAVWRVSWCRSCGALRLFIDATNTRSTWRYIYPSRVTVTGRDETARHHHREGGA